MREHNILPVSYSGLTPLWRVKGGPLDSVLEDVVTRTHERTGKTITSAQALQLWLRKKGIPYTT